MTTTTIKKILVTGSSGYVGNSIIQKLAKSHPKISIIGMSRTGLPRANSKTELLENVTFQKGDCLNVDSFRDLVGEVDSVVHTVGTLIENKNNVNLTYKAMNRDAAVNVMEVLNESSLSQSHENSDLKKRFVIISAGRAPPLLDEYLTMKHEADNHLLNNCSNLIGTVIRPGFIHDTQRLWSIPLRFGVDIAHCFDNITPNALKKFNLIPDASVALDSVAFAASEAAVGNVNHENFGHIISNEMMRDYQNGKVKDFL